MGLCCVFLDKLSFDVKIRLCHSYCTSYYGCELWNLCTNQLTEFCTNKVAEVRSSSVESAYTNTLLFAPNVVSLSACFRRNL